MTDRTISRNCGMATKEKRKGAEAIFEVILIENFSQINVRHQASEPNFTEHQAG